MIRIENTSVFGWEAAIRGMRNPMNSWDKSETQYNWKSVDFDFDEPYIKIDVESAQIQQIGKNDLKLMRNLSKAGSDHGKFLRMINVTMDVTAPLYWWKEFDTYKVGTVANSCSTMHKIHAKEFTLDDFSHEHLLNFDDPDPDIELDDFPTYESERWDSEIVLDVTITALNHYREKYLFAKTKPMKEEAKRSQLMKRYWWQMIQLLPSSYNQKRTVQLNYQVLKAMYFARKNHKLDEWKEFCAWVETLPYFKEVCVDVVDL